MWSSLFSLLFVLIQPAYSEGFSTEAVARAHRQVAPAICLVMYSSEISNARTGDITRRDNNALGLIVSKTGLVITPGRMKVEDSEPYNIQVTVGQGDSEREYSAQLLKKPDDVNVCFLQLESDTPLDLPYVQFKRGSRLELGEPVLLFGILSKTLDYARGIFPCTIGAILDKPRTTYCLDRSIRFGYVGGPVINRQGEAVGIIGFDLSRSEGGDLYVRSGYPLVYQTDLFQKYIDTPPGEPALEQEGVEAWLGVLTQPLTDDFAEYWELPKEGGIVIASIVPNTPADKAGLMEGDVVIEFNGIPLHAKQNREVVIFTKRIREAGIGKAVPIKFYRQGEIKECNAFLEERPKPARDAGEFEDKIFGLTVREITTDVRLALNVSEEVKGVIVRRVKSGSVADLAGMRAGLIIMNIGNLPIVTTDDFKTAVEKIAEAKPQEVTVFCRAGSATGFLRLEPRWENQEK